MDIGDEEATGRLVRERAEPYSLLTSITPWKPKMMPTLRGGPRYVEVHFADGSSACFTTDAVGEAALTART